MQKLYNIIVRIIVEITNNVKEDFYKKYRGRSSKKRREEIESIQKQLPEVFEQGTSRYRAIEKSDELGCAFVNHLIELFDCCKRDEDYCCLLRVLEVLDAALERQMQREAESAWNEGTESCLNSNWNTMRVGIVPRCKCNWERAHRGSQYYDRIENYLINMLVIDYRRIEGTRIYHHYLPPELFYRAEQNGELTVAVSAFKPVRDFQENDYERESISYFSIQYCGSEEEDNKRIKKIISQAAEESVDILIFPEMLGNTKMVEDIADYLQDSIWFQQSRSPALTLLPTVWNQRTNAAYLLDRGGGVVCAQNKQKSYIKPDSSETEILEDIIEDHVIHLIHCIGIGRMTIMICKDFISMEYLELMLKELKVTLILIPSFSTGYHDFDMMAGKLLPADCCAIWVNACAAVLQESKKEKNIGFLLKSGKNRVKDEERREFFRMEESCRNEKCDRTCLRKGKLYYGVRSAEKVGKEEPSGKERIL